MIQTAPAFPFSFPVHATLTTLDLPPQAGIITSLAWSEDNAHLAAVSSTGMLLIWQAQSGACVLARRVARTRLTAVAWSRQGKSVLLGNTRGSLSVFHLSSRTLVHSTTFSAPIAQIALSPSSVETRFFVRTGSSLYLFTQGQPEPRQLHYPTPLVGACWAPDGQSLALVCAHGLVQVCDTRTLRVRWQSTRVPAHPLRVTWDATGSRLAIGQASGAVQVHDLRHGEVHTPLPLSRFPIQALDWGEQYLVAGSEREVAFWSEQHGSPHSESTRAPVTFTFDSFGTVLATAWPDAIALTTLA